MNKLGYQQTQTDEGLPFWRLSWLSFIGEKTYSKLGENMVKVIHIHVQLLSKIFIESDFCHN